VVYLSIRWKSKIWMPNLKSPYFRTSTSSPKKAKRTTI